jgi:hypothetical protein
MSLHRLLTSAHGPVLFATYRPARMRWRYRRWRRMQSLKISGRAQSR